MCHCIADTREELLAMMTLIGVQHKWLQHKDHWHEHFDISKGKRQIAISHGAIPITSRELVRNFDHEELLAQKYRQQGKKSVHLCPDWDFMAIHSLSPEFEACLCDLSALP